MPHHDRENAIEMNDLGKTANAYIPFTYGTMNEDFTNIDHIILEYLDPNELSSLSASAQGYEAHTLLTTPANAIIPKSYKLLYEQFLANVHLPYYRSVRPSSEIVDFEKAYKRIIHENESFMRRKLEDALTGIRSTAMTREAELYSLKEIIFHLGISRPQNLGFTLNNHIDSQRTDLLLAMIDAGATIKTGYALKSTLGKALSKNVSDEVINALFAADQDYEAFNYPDEEFNHYAYACLLLRLNKKNLGKMVADKPYLTSFFFQLLSNAIQSEPTLKLTCSDGRYQFSYPSGLAMNTKFELMKICKKDMAFNTSEKQIVLDTVMTRIKAATTIAQLERYAGDHRYARIFSYHRHPLADKLFGFFQQQSNFTTSSVSFIEALQVKTLIILDSGAFINACGPTPNYLAECKKALELPYFSAEYDKHGVCSLPRKELEIKIAHIEAIVAGHRGRPAR